MATSIVRGKQSRFQSQEFAESATNVKSGRGSQRFDVGGNGYFTHCDTKQKEQQRNLVTSFLNDIPVSQIRLCSLPGIGWDVERDLHSMRENTQFVGVELDESTFLISQKNMPDAIRSEHKSRKATAMLSLYDGSSVNCVHTLSGRSWSFNCDANAVIRSSGTWKLATAVLPDQHNIRSHITRPLHRRFNSFWLDTFSPLGSTTCLSLLASMFSFAARSEETRFAITFMIGRDMPDVTRIIHACPGSDSLEQRSSFIQLLAANHKRPIAITNNHRHASWNEDGQVTMGTVFGILAPTRKP